MRCDSLLLSARYNVTYASPNDTSGFARYPDVATYRCEGGFYASPAIHMRTCFTDTILGCASFTTPTSPKRSLFT